MKDIIAEQRRRRERGAALAASGAVEQRSLVSWKVRGKPYTISLGDKVTCCTCPDYQARGEQVGPCKHIRAAQVIQRAKVRVEKIGPDEAIRYAITRLAWEQDRFAKDCLKALVLVARQQQSEALGVTA